MKHAKLIIIALIVVGGLVAAFTLPVTDYLKSFLEWVEGLGVWGPVLVGLIYIPATVFFIPGSVITLGAGALFGVVVGTIVVSLGSTAGSTAAFLVGRFFARDWVAEKVKGNAKFEALDKAVGKEGFKIVLLTRLSPIFPYNMLGYMYGITDVKLSHYVLASWIGMLPGTVMYVYFGSLAGTVAQVAAGETPEGGQTDTLKWVLYGVGFVATVVVTVFVTKVATKAMRNAAPSIANDEGETENA